MSGELHFSDNQPVCHCQTKQPYFAFSFSQNGPFVQGWQNEYQIPLKFLGKFSAARNMQQAVTFSFLWGRNSPVETIYQGMHAEIGLYQSKCTHKRQGSESFHRTDLDISNFHVFCFCIRFRQFATHHNHFCPPISGQVSFAGNVVMSSFNVLGKWNLPGSWIE